MGVFWTRRYLREFASIGDYIAQHNPRAAARFINTVHSRTSRLLTDNPFICRPGQIRGRRELVIPGTPYVVAYRVDDAQIDILFVQHGAREWPEDV